MRDCRSISQLGKSTPPLSPLDLLHADAVARTVRERMEAVAAVAGEFRVPPIGQPAFREEFFCAGEVEVAEVHCAVGDAEDGLAGEGAKKMFSRVVSFAWVNVWLDRWSHSRFLGSSLRVSHSPRKA